MIPIQRKAVHRDNIDIPESALRLNVSRKHGSIGEMPPKTVRTREVSAFTAWPARFTMREKMLQFWSSSKFQCDRLFGSFQSITASIMSGRLSCRRKHQVPDG
jgi:hypothetical protein